MNAYMLEFSKMNNEEITYAVSLILGMFRIESLTLSVRKNKTVITVLLKKPLKEKTYLQKLGAVASEFPVQPRCWVSTTQVGKYTAN
jgi:hypothetical protein